MKLRLLLFKECNRNCRGCCNNDWGLNNLPIEKNFSNYEEILLTGGEPMLKPNLVIAVAKKIRKQSDAKIFMYTAKVDKPFEVLEVLNYIDGITVTLHEPHDVLPFLTFNSVIEGYDKSFRLNVFKGVKLPEMANVKRWKIKKDMVWIKNCPLPKDEVFKKFGGMK